MEIIVLSQTLKSSLKSLETLSTDDEREDDDKENRKRSGSRTSSTAGKMKC